MNLGIVLLFYILIMTALVFPPAWLAVFGTVALSIKVRRDRRRYSYR